MLPDTEIRNRPFIASAGWFRPPAASAEVSEEALVAAFTTFSDAASSLQKSYAMLRAEVARLRKELAGKDRELEEERAHRAKLQAIAEASNMLAHEVRNPLASLELFSSLAANAAEVSGETRNWLHQVQGGLRTLSATVNNVLHSQHLPEAELWPIDASEVIRGFVEFLFPLAQQHGVEIVVERGVTATTMLGDPNRLQQVLLNLGLNALHAMPKGGELRVRKARRDRWVEISVIDSGAGIAPENLEHIFEQGFSTRAESSGLGLAVCKKIMDQHGGEIFVTSKAGKGSHFTLRLRAL